MAENRRQVDRVLHRAAGHTHPAPRKLNPHGAGGWLARYLLALPRALLLSALSRCASAAASLGAALASARWHSMGRPGLQKELPPATSQRRAASARPAPRCTSL